MPRDNTPDIISIPASGLPGELSADSALEPNLWHQVDAFRELLQEGAQLLGEVLLFTRNAEESLAALGREKSALDEQRETLRKEREHASRESQFAAEQLRAQEQELELLRARLLQRESEHDSLTQNEADRSRSLQRALRETEARAHSLEEELKQTRQASLVHAIQAVEEDKAEEGVRLKSLEHELEQTRLILASERLRRNRAISLIRPSQGKGTSS